MKHSGESFTPSCSNHGACFTAFSTDCKVVIKVIDVNNEMPVFEKNNVSVSTCLRIWFIWMFALMFVCFKLMLLCWCVYVQYDNLTLAEDAVVGLTVLTIRATDADDADSGSSRIEFHITAGNDDDVFTVETDGSGVGHVVIARVRLHFLHLLHKNTNDFLFCVCVLLTCSLLVFT